MYCCLCGRSLTRALVFIGSQPVGEVCARRAGLVSLAKKKTGAVRLAARIRTARALVPKTVDMFEQLENESGTQQV